MKIFSILSIQLLALCGTVFSQCPPTGLKIQTPICDTPKNLRVNDIKCETIKLNWQGNNEQKYIAEATGTDNTAKTIFEVKPADYSCDESGNCAATISVQQGAKVNWSVQAICNINGVTIYSPKIEGKQAVVPYCNNAIAAQEKINNLNEKIRVYPNPTTGNLTVEYYSNTKGSMQLKVFDAAGKLVFTNTVNVSVGSNSYNLNLHSLVPGAYLLETNSDRIKFVLLRK